MEQITIAMIAEDDRGSLLGVVPEELLQEKSVCVAALTGEDLCGVLVAVPVEETVFDISYLLVLEEYRRRGVAKGMLNLLTMSLQLYGGGTLLLNFMDDQTREANRRRRRSALSGKTAPEEKDGAGEGNGEGEPEGTEKGISPEDLGIRLFAEHMSFQQRRDSVVYELRFSEFQSAAEGFPQESGSLLRIHSLKIVTVQQWNGLISLLAEKNREAVGRDSMQVYIRPEERSFYDPDISQVSLDEKGTVDGVFLAHGDRDGLLVDYIAVFNPRKTNMTWELLRHALQGAEGSVGPDTPIRFHAYNPAVEQLGRKVLGRRPEVVGHAAYYTKRI